MNNEQIEQSLRDSLAAMVRSRKALAHLNGLTIATPYCCPEDYVLRHGSGYASQPLTATEDAQVRAVIKATRSRFPIKQCYANSQRVVTSGATADGAGVVKYVEGYVMLSDVCIPILHGWLSVNGKVVDLTLRKRGEPRVRGPLGDRVFGTFQNRAYIGVEFPTRYVQDVLVSSEHYTSLLDNWFDRWPLLTGAHDPLAEATERPDQQTQLSLP